ncbi:MAG: nSTAND1 domain-containing NTPase, partial [Kofleriaceae bacterium]
MFSGDQVGNEAEGVLAADTRVDGFRIRGLLGEGAMGQVYLAQDVTLGRRVALKLFKRAVIQAHGLDRFLDEARTTASFSHPNIVTLHAVGEFEGRPFLALEYVDGESLRARIRGGPLSVREALRAVRAVAEAMDVAHRRDLVHADLKPENIVIPHDGRVRVVDFGLARLVGTGTDAASGTPAYMAPERWRLAPPTGAIDVWALGIILYELITGALPFTDHALRAFAFGTHEIALPAEPTGEWLAVVRACLTRDPAARPTADELARRVSALLDPSVARLDDASCPFPGLAAFERTDADYYFGREAELDALLEQLRTRALVPIVGPSGIGKSSFVYAGLLPRLEELATWTVLHLRPGTSPFESLAQVLAPEDPAGLAASLRAHPARLSLALADACARRGTRVLVFVDQFEEAFTLAAAEAIAFCDCLALAAMADEPWRIVLTIRDDFVGRLAEPLHMRRHLGAVLVLPPLGLSDLRTAITGPLANVGYGVDAPELVARIVDDVAGQPAGLPLLQFACRALWDRRDLATRTLSTREYDAIGGASGALATHAQRFMAQLSSDQVRLVRGVLLELVHADGTRRPRWRSELAEAMGAGAGVVIDRLLEHRLLVSSREAEHDDARIELAHEALATAWPQLARWLDETYEQRLLVHELDQASTLWSKRGPRDDETWSGAALEEAIRKVTTWNVALPTRARRFLDAGARRARHARRRRRWIIGGVVGVLGATTIVAAVAAITAFRQQAEVRLAAADMGIFELELEPFDWDPVQQRRISPAELPPFAWRLRAVHPDDPRSPGRIYAEGRQGDVRRGTPGWRDGVLVETVEARSGPAFLEVDQRGGDCPSSRLYLQHVPGYTQRTTPPRRIRIPIPTCQASRADMVQIPEGEFYRHVNRENGSAPRDELARLPAFAIDRTEVTRNAFEIYEQLTELTGGDTAAPGDYLALEGPGRGWSPIVGVTFFTATRYCQYLGKTLPTIDQWQKAFRGGLVLDGRPNPDPRRLTPWLAAASERPANLRPPERNGTPSVVGAYPEDT